MRTHNSFNLYQSKMGLFFACLIFTSIMALITPFSKSQNAQAEEVTILGHDTYSTLMDEYRMLSRNLSLDGYVLDEIELLTHQADLKASFEALLVSEQTNLTTSSIAESKKQSYYDQLNAIISALDTGGTAVITSESLDQEVTSLSFIYDDPTGEAVIPEEPSEFRFADTNISVDSLNLGDPENVIQASGVNSNIVQDMPKHADVVADGKEIILDGVIYSLAAELNNNPVQIVNYILENIDYEPYYGAKKGALGCLQEKSCNDVDASSLTISLFRAAGIPARYKKEPVIMSVDQVTGLLGVGEVRTAYAALKYNNIPVYPLDSPSSGIPLDTYDFGSETHFILLWTHPEIYFEYDEFEGNRSSVDDFTDAETDGDVEDVVLASPNAVKKQWLGVEPVLKSYDRIESEIVHDSASFDTAAFWTGFLSYQDGLSPLDKYKNDLISATGKDINDSQYHSTKTRIFSEIDLLPPTLPYFSVNVQSLPPETFSELSDSNKNKVIVSIKKQSDNSILLTEQFSGSEINNSYVKLSYRGETQADRDLIESYGGIHAVPASLVSIVPVIQTSGSESGGSVPVSIGEVLILEYRLSLDNEDLYVSQKFSIAGNEEGSYITLSDTIPDGNHVELSDSLYSSRVLSGGNASLAREYLRRSFESGELLKKSLDFDFQVGFAQATVTQNRQLAPSNGIPTAFDFKGLTIDAGIVFGGMYSNRGNYKNHLVDFNLLLGLQLSHDEAAFFEDTAGLEAISTVSGIQYANENPQEYTVYTITAANESTIDTLQLSSNTRQIMHEQIALGRKIITPDRPISKGQFNGILYISIDSEGIGRYAIGEQVSNGAWTTEFVGSKLVFYAPDGTAHFIFQIEDTGEDNIFIITDEKTGERDACRLDHDTFDSIINEPGYSVATHGSPCIGETTLNFGSNDHTFLVTTLGAKFKGSPLYPDSWVTEDGVRSLFATSKPSWQLADFGFDLKYGTYTAKDKTLEITSDRPPILFYNPISSNPISVTGWYGMKLDHELDNAIFEKTTPGEIIGFPIDERNSDVSGIDYSGSEQDFFAGKIYYYETNFLKVPHIYFLPGKIADFHAVTEHGFPKEDPRYKNDGTTLKQEFYEHGIAWDTNTSDPAYLEYASEFLCNEIDTESSLVVAQAFFQGTAEGGGVAAKGMIQFIGAAGVGASVAAWAFGPGASVAVYGAEAGVLLLIGAQLIDVFNEFVIQGQADAVLQGAAQWIKDEYERSTCTARKVYLVSRVGSEFAGYVIGFGGANRAARGAMQLQLGVTIHTQLNAIKNGIRDDIKVLLSTNSNQVVEPFIAVGEKKYLELSDRLVAKQGDNVPEGDLLRAAQQSYRGAAYKSALEMLGYKLSRNSTYRKNFINKVENEGVELPADDLFQVDHRIPASLAEKNAKGVQQFLDDLSIKDINDPRLLQAVDRFENAALREEWSNFITSNPNATGFQIRDFLVELDTLRPDLIGIRSLDAFYN